MESYINDTLIFNETSIEKLVEEAVEMAEKAANNISETGREKILAAFDCSSNQSKILVDEFLNFSITFFTRDLGNTTALVNIYLGFRNTMCYTILDEFNMAWAAIGFVILFSVPLVISASFLESVLRRNRELKPYDDYRY